MKDTSHLDLVTWPRFRYLRESWNERSKWVLSSLISDEEAATRGYAKAGQGRDASQLSERDQKELFEHLKSGKSIDKERLEDLLGHCGFTTYVGILDIDVNNESFEFDPEKSRNEALEYAKRLAYYAPEFGLGNPNWYSTGWTGGFHADLVAPEYISDPDLLAAVKLMVTRLADRAGVPLYLRQPGFSKRDRKRRIPVYLDDSVINKYPQAKGGLWRLPGTSKPGGKKKTLIDILAHGCPEISVNSNFKPIDETTLIAALKEVKSKLIEPVKHATIEIVDAPGPLVTDDFNFLNEHHDLLKIWNRKKVTDRSYRDFEFVMQALYYGADDSLACRLMRAMPGSKSTQDKRNTDYDTSIISSARRCLSNPYEGLGKYQGYLKPRNFTETERLIILRASELAWDEKIKRKLIATLNCGEVNPQSRCDEIGINAFEQIERCERSTCAYCEPRRIFIRLTQAAVSWPSELIILSIETGPLPSDNQTAFDAFRKKTKKKFGKKTTKLLSEIRSFRSPEELLIVSPASTESKKLLEIYPSAKIITKTDCLLKLKETLYLRFTRVLKYLELEDATGLARDHWSGHVVTTTSGRRARKHLEWLSKEDLRDVAKSQNLTNSEALNAPKIIQIKIDDLQTDIYTVLQTNEVVMTIIKPTSKILEYCQKPPD